MVSMDKNSYRGPDLKLFVRDVRDRQGKKRPITVRSWATIKDVKDSIQQVIHVPPSAQRLYFGPLLTSEKELPNYRSLHDAGIYRSGETLLLDIKSGSSLSVDSTFSPLNSLRSCNNDVTISTSMIDSTPKPLRDIVQQARRGFALGLKPDLVLDGSGGSYFLHDARKTKISVFKPADEEPYAENNPRGYLPQPGASLSLRDGVIPGEACIREVAAFILDHGGFSGVPMTTLVEARHPAFNTNGARLSVALGGASIGSHSITPNSPVKPPHMKKAGSFQEFVRHECTMDDISPSKIGVEEVQKIAILDIRIMNADRNSANLLCRRRRDNSMELVPIDHGFCLRSTADVSWMDWCWLDWPQLKQPLSGDVKAYVLNLDIEADARLLRERLNICEEAIDIFRASSSLLKAGVEAGLTLYDIAVMCCRNDDQGEIPSKLERLSTMASELSSIAIENEKWSHAAASRALEDQLTPKRGRRFLDGRGLCKSVSSGEFLSLAGESGESIGEVIAKRDSPGMAGSSGSDSSSDSGEVQVEPEECEEWAASIIADVSVDQIPTVSQRSARSGSIASDDGSTDSTLSGSPKGFWHVRPGTPPMDDDDGSITWSPHGSPPDSFARGTKFLSPPSTLAGHNFSFGANTIAKVNMKRPSVTFAPILTQEKPFMLPVSMNLLKLKPAELELPIVTEVQRQDSGMTRSKSHPVLNRSYSVTSTSSSNEEASARRSLKPFSHTDTYEAYRKYYLKFIDLVVVREMTTAVHHSKIRSEGLVAGPG